MTDVGKFWTCVLLGIIIAFVAGINAGQILAPFIFAIYAILIGVVCMTVESITRKTLTVLLVGAVPTAIYYFVAANQFAWIFFLCGTVFFTFIACLKEPKKSS